MIVVLLTYKVSLEEVTRVRGAHIDWLKRGVADGMLLAAGRKDPVTGGMFLARGTLDDVKAWAATDPFATEGVAEYEFIDITVSVTTPGLEALAQ